MHLSHMVLPDDILPYYGSSDIASIDEVISFWNSVNQTSTIAQESSYAFEKKQFIIILIQRELIILK